MCKDRQSFIIWVQSRVPLYPIVPSFDDPDCLLYIKTIPWSRGWNYVLSIAQNMTE